MKPTYEDLQQQLAAIDAINRLINEKVAALAAENATLKSGSTYFSYGSEHNFEWHKSAKEAVEAAEAAIDDYRGDACDGWSEEVDSICWGVIMQSSTKVGERPRSEDDRCDPEIDTVCDYALLPNIETSATDAAIAELQSRAEAAERSITINALRSFVTDDDLQALRRFTECCDDPGAGGHDLESEQVNRLEKIGALQRSGRISYITDFGDLLISISAGIQINGR